MSSMIDDGSQSVKIGSCGVVRERLKERVERGREGNVRRGAEDVDKSDFWITNVIHRKDIYS